MASTPIQALEQYLRGLIRPDGTLTLPARDERWSADLLTLFSADLGEQGILLTQARVGIPVGLDYVEVTGIGHKQDPPFGAATMVAQFTVHEAGATETTFDMTLVATIQTTGIDRWTFVDNFAKFKDTFVDDLWLGDPTTFRLSSCASGAIPKGFTIDGVLRLTGNASLLSAIFPNPLPILGVIDRVPDHNPVMRITSKAPDPIVIPPFAFNFELELTNGVPPPEPPDKANPVMAAVAKLRYGSGADEVIPIRSEYPFGDPSITISSDDSVLTLGMSLVSKLLGDNASSVMPPSFPVLDLFTLKRWSLSINPSTLSVESVTVSVWSKQPWDITSRLSLDSLRFEFATSQQMGQPPLVLTLYASFAIDQGVDPEAHVDFNAMFPQFTLTGGLRRDGVTLLLPSLGRLIDDSAAGVLPNLGVKKLDFRVDPSTATYSVDATIQTPWQVPLTPFTLDSVRFAIKRQGQATSGLLAGTIGIDPSHPDSLISVSAAYASTDGWTFAGYASQIDIDLGQVVNRYFPSFLQLDLGQIHIERADASFATSGKYAFSLEGSWSFVVPDTTYTFTLWASIDLQQEEPSKSKPPYGHVEGAATFHGLPVRVGARSAIDQPWTKYIKLGTAAEIALTGKKLDFTFGQETLGSMIEMLVNAATGGQSFTLPAPWDQLNSVSLNGLTFEIDLTTGQRKAGFIKSDLNLNFGFAEIEEIGLFYNVEPTATNKVEFQLRRGRILNESFQPDSPKKWDVLDPSGAPAVPGVGQGAFKLQFLAMGQHVRVRNPIDMTSVWEAVEDLEDAFRPAPGATAMMRLGSSPIAGRNLAYAADHDWMFGITALILDGTVALRAIFYDPELYGLSVRLAGAKAKAFAGLKFDILYRKINDNLGVYQLDLTLPDSVRNLEFGALSITLPIIHIEIYTNGNFKVDFGFPYNGDFTRSFTAQVFPFIGSAGFYFGVLDGASSTKLPVFKDPKNPPGTFGPVIEIGLGARLGIGREIRKGVMSAGLSLTLQGIVEGVFATFNTCPRGSMLPGHALTLTDDKDDAFYYWVRGTFAIVGKLFGEIDFAIISARLDVTASISVTVVIETYRPVIVNFSAQVSVSVSVRINLGLFKITIRLSFSMGLSEQFSAGSWQQAPWDGATLPVSRVTRRLTTALDEDPCSGTVVAMKWQPVLCTPLQPVPLIVTTQLTAASPIVDERPAAAKAAAVVMFYVQSTIGEDDVTTPSPFDSIARGALLWAINARLNRDMSSTTLDDVLNKTITAADLADIDCALHRPGELAPFDPDQVDQFVSHFFAFTVTPAAAQSTEPEKSVSVFPVVPALTLTRPDGKNVEFWKWNVADAAWLQRIKTEFNELEIKAGKKPGRPALQLPGAWTEASLATFIYVDYFAMLARATIQAAIDNLKAAAVRVPEGQSLADLLAAHPEWGVSVAEIARANRLRPLRRGVTVAIPRSWDLSVTAVPVQHEIDASTETLDAIARHFRVTLEDLLSANAHVPNLFATASRMLLPAVEGMTVRELVDQMQERAAFEHISGLAARVFLQGLRPSWKNAQGVDEPTALYEISGQQFDAGAATPGPWYSLAVPTGQQWISFDVGGQSSTTLDVARTQADAALITAFTGATLGPDFRTFEQSFYETRAKRFTLANPMVWQQPAGARLTGVGAGSAIIPAPSIWLFPADLQTLLSGADPVQPVVAIRRETSDAPHLTSYVLPAVDENHSWATVVNVTVRRIPADDHPDSALPFAYECLGTDDAGSSYLEQLLGASSVAIDQIYCLFPPQGGNAAPPLGLVSLPVTGLKYFLLQTNLSTASNPGATETGGNEDADVPPIGMSPVEFLTYLWECSVVRSGGYYLYLEATGGHGLPDHLFEQTSEVVITLVVTHQDPQDVLRGYMNGVVYRETIDLDHEILYIEAIDTAVALDVTAPTIGEMARRHRVPLVELCEQLGGQPLAAGIDLALPIAPAASHRTVAGDTLAAIAGARRIPLSALAAANRDRAIRFSGDATVDERLTERIINLPPGNVGIKIMRRRPEAVTWDGHEPLTPSMIEAALESLYNLAGYEIVATDYYVASSPGLPLTPSTDGQPPSDVTLVQRAPQEIGPWIYKASLPLTPFVQPPQKGPANLPPRADNPYLPVGHDAIIGFDWLDLFGNRMQQTADPGYLTSIASTFYDNLIGVSEWPSLGCSYVITPTADLAVTLRLDGSPYQGTVEGWRTRAETDLARYQAIYYQLVSQAKISVTTSMDPSHPRDVTSQMIDFAGRIYDYLHTRLYPPPTPITLDPPVAILTGTVDDSSGLLLFALQVAIVIERTGAIADALDDPLFDAVRRVETPVSPDVRKYDANPSGVLVEEAAVTLQQFAHDLEEAFSTLKVAVGTNPPGSPTAGARQIWLMRFGTDGFEYSFVPKPRYFAVQPLARDPQSPQNVPIYSYSAGTPIWKEEPAPRNFSNVDLDTTASDFLTAVDQFLSAGCATRAWLVSHQGTAVDPEPVSSVLDSKRVIAKAIAARLAGVYDEQPEPTPDEMVVDKLEQELLIQLAAAYQIDTIVQIPMTVRSPLTKLAAPRLFGQLMVTPAVSGETPSFPYSLSTARVPLDATPGAASLTFTFSTRDKTHASVVSLDVGYRINAIEHDVHQVPGIDDYLASSWLTFVFPLGSDPRPAIKAALALDDVLALDIPVPLRAVPVPPTLTEQSGTAAFEPPVDLRESKLWDYAFGYQYKAADHDRIHAAIQFNTIRRSSSADEDEPDLLTALLQFTAAYPAMRPDLATSLNAAQSFAWLVNRVAMAWRRWNVEEVSAGASRDLLAIVESKVVVDHTPDVFAITVAREDGATTTAALPVVDLPDVTRKENGRTLESVEYVYLMDGDYVPYELGRNILNRSVGYPQLDLLGFENAIAGLTVKRNELYDGRKGNPAFVYSSALAQYATSVTPMLTPDIQLDMAHFVDPGQHTLQDYLAGFVRALLTYAGTAEERTVRLQCGYVFDIGGDTPASAFAIEVPQLLTKPFTLSPADAGKLDDLAEFILNWFRERNLVGCNGSLRFRVSLFASLSDIQLPILQLDDVILAAKLIWK